MQISFADFCQQRKMSLCWCPVDTVTISACSNTQESEVKESEPKNNGFWLRLLASDGSQCRFAKQNYTQNGCFGAQRGKEYMAAFPSINLPSSAQRHTTYSD